MVAFNINRQRRKRVIVWVMLLTMIMSILPHVVTKPVKAEGDGGYDAAVYAGSSKTFVIKPDGTLWGKGYRFLGDGTPQSRNEFVQILSDKGPIASVADGGEHVLVLTTDGQVWAWGNNKLGELGNGTTSTFPISVPVQVQLPEGVHIKEIAAASRYSLALSTDGELWEWGLSPQHTSSSNRKLVPDRVRDENGEPITNIKTIEAYQNSVFAVTNNGEVWVWGYNTQLQLGFEEFERRGPTKLTTIGQVENIATEGSHTVALRADGTVWGWGKNMKGELGTGIALSERTHLPTPIYGLENIVSVEVGEYSTLALDAEGNLWALGNQLFLGFEENDDSVEPVQVGGEWGQNVDSITSYRSNIFAVKRDGSIWGWGSNHYGQIISDIADSTIETPTLVDFDNLVSGLPLQYEWLHPQRGQTQVSVHEEVSLSFNRDIVASEKWGEIRITDEDGEAVSGISSNVSSNEIIIAHDAFELDTIYEVLVPSHAVVDANGRSNPEIRWTFKTISHAVPEVEAISPAEDSQIAPDGAIRVYYTSPVTAGLALEDVTLVDEGGQETANIRAVVEGNRLTILHHPLQEYTEYTVTIPADAVRNEEGNSNELLQWTFTTGAAKSLPVEPDAVLGTGDHRTFIFESGSLWGWGRNEKGVLGGGTQIEQHSPVPVQGSLTNVKQIVSGQYHNAALKDDGTVWTWGNQKYGELGNGTVNEPNPIPVQVAGLQDIVQIASGQNHLVALKQDGTVWTWGRGLNGILGNGSTSSSSVPVQVEGLTGIKTVTAGSQHTLALGEDGRVWAWGINFEGQLGDGTNEERHVPVPVGDMTHVTAIAAGHAFSLALRQDGTLWGWGSNSKGQLGQDTATLEQALLPIEMTEMTDVLSLSGGYETAYALLQDGTIWGWGSGQYGMLGTGDEENTHEPVQILSDVETMDVSSFTNQSHAVALKTNGDVWGWGFNGGELYAFTVLRNTPESSILSPAVTMYGSIGSDQAPVVIEASPDQGEEEVEIDAQILLTFHESVELQSGRSLDEVNITTAGLEPEPVEHVHASLEDGTLVMEHDPFNVRTTYIVHIPAGLFVDEVGNDNKEIDFWFRTIQGDMEPPQPIHFIPDHAERNVPVANALEVNFDEPVYPGTWLNHIQLVDEQGTHWSVTPIVSGDKLVIGHDPLDYSTDYTLNIPVDAVQDELGNHNEAFSWTFRTRGEAGEEVEVHFINVGQGDGIYMKLPGNVDVVVDSGNWNSPSAVVNYLESQNVDDIEYLIATHMDADHIGGMANLLNRYTVETIIDNGRTASSQTYADYQQARLNEITNEEAEYIRVQDRDDLQSFSLTDPVELRLIGPVQTGGSSNENSIVAILDTGEIEVMLTGDAEHAQENDIIAYGNDEGIDLQAEVLKVAHHGSASSTSSPFLEAVQPMSAIISVGSNSYGHPTQEVLDRLNAAGSTIYRTDLHSLNGAIVMVTDGSSYKINDEWIIPPEDVESATPKPATEKITWLRTGEGKVQLTGLTGAVQKGATIRVYMDAAGEALVAETTVNEDGTFFLEFNLAETVKQIYITATEANKEESAAAVLLLEDHWMEPSARIALELPDGPYAKPGEPIRVNVVLEDYVNIYGAQFQLQYDPEFLSLVDQDLEQEGLQIKMGGLFAEKDHAEVLNFAETNSGTVYFGSMLLGKSQGVSGERGVLAELQFVPISQSDTKTEISLIADGTKITAYPQEEPSWAVDPVISEPAVISIQGEKSGETVIDLVSDKQTIAHGDTVTFQVYLDDYEDLYGVQLRLDYDPTMLRPIDQNIEMDGIQAREGMIFQDRSVEIVVNEADVENGKAAYAAVLTGNQAGVSGQAPSSIVEWVFEPIGSAGNTSVNLVKDQIKLAGQPREDGEPVKLYFNIGQSALNVKVKQPPNSDTEPPTWPSQAKLEATDITSNSMTLNWPEAMDNNQVAYYELYVGSEDYMTVTNTTYSIDGLQAGTSYEFFVTAVDPSENVSEPLRLRATTLSEGSSGGNSGGDKGGNTGGDTQDNNSGNGGSQLVSRDRAWDEISTGLTANAEAVQTETTEVDGKQTIVLWLDDEKWQQAFAQLREKDQDERKLHIVVDDDQQPVMLQIPLAQLKNGLLEATAAVIVLQVGGVSYELPLAILETHIADADEQATLNLVVDILKEADREELKSIVSRKGATLISDIADFKIFIDDNGRRTNLNTFHDQKVVRIFRIKGGVNPNISTGVRIENGELFFIPSTFERDGSDMIVMLTNDRNSVYAVVEHRKTFKDIAEHWAKAEIELLASKLIVEGVSDFQFAPDRNITRAEFTVLLARALGLEAAGTSERFIDVPTDAWYADDVYAAVRVGIVTGYPDGSFRPQQTITREEAAVLISRAMAYAGTTASLRGDSTKMDSFIDRNEIGDWATGGLRISIQAGIIDGLPDGSFRPAQETTRAEAAVMLKRLLQVLGYLDRR